MDEMRQLELANGLLYGRIDELTEADSDLDVWRADQ